jgi:hypothetical protein
MPCDVVQPRWCLSLVFGKDTAAGRIFGMVGVIVKVFAFVSVDSIGRYGVPGDRPRVRWGGMGRDVVPLVSVHGCLGELLLRAG